MTARVLRLKRGRSWVTAIAVAAFVLLADSGAVFALLGAGAAVANAQGDPAAMQKQGIARLAEYVDNFRRTFDKNGFI